MALHVRALLVVVGAPCLSGFIVPPAPLSRVASSGQWQAHLPQRQRLPVMAVSEKEEAELDKLVRAEIEAAFAGLEEKFANGEDEEAIEIIRTQGKTVLSNVLEKLEEDGQLLSGQLASRIEELAEDQSTQLLARYEGEIDRTRAQMDVERANIRNEVERLEALNKELQELQVKATSERASTRALRSRVTDPSLRTAAHRSAGVSPAGRRRAVLQSQQDCGRARFSGGPHRAGRVDQ